MEVGQTSLKLWQRNTFLVKTEVEICKVDLDKTPQDNKWELKWPNLQEIIRKEKRKKENTLHTTTTLQV